MHPARAARVALMHTWQSTQTEGWWRQAFDIHGVPYDYISVQDVARTPNLREKYDVIVFGPGGGNGQAIIDGMPMWRNPMPWKTVCRDAESHAVRLDRRHAAGPRLAGPHAPGGVRQQGRRVHRRGRQRVVRRSSSA